MATSKCNAVAVSELAQENQFDLAGEIYQVMNLAESLADAMGYAGNRDVCTNPLSPEKIEGVARVIARELLRIGCAITDHG